MYFFALEKDSDAGNVREEENKNMRIRQKRYPLFCKFRPCERYYPLDNKYYNL